MQIGYFTAGFVYGGGQNAFSATEFMMPPGYNSKAAIRTLAKTQTSAWLGISGQKLKEQQQGAADEEIDYAAIRGKLQGALERGQQNMQVIVGTPTTVIPKIKAIMSVLRVGVFIILHLQGPHGNDERRTSMRLFAEEVMPALKDHARAIGIADPFERQPGSVPLGAGTKRAPVVDRGPLSGLGFH